METMQYRCRTCGAFFSWGPESSWYGSYRDLEKKGLAQTPIFCSDDCLNAYAKENNIKIEPYGKQE